MNRMVVNNRNYKSRNSEEEKGNQRVRERVIGCQREIESFLYVCIMKH